MAAKHVLIVVGGVVAVAVVTAGVVISGALGTVTVTPQGANAPSPVMSGAPAAPACSTVFVPGQVVRLDGANGVCTDPDGTTIFLGVFRCNDGRHLWSVDANTGAPNGWAFSGEVFHAVASNIADDPGYSKAYETCHS